MSNCQPKQPMKVKCPEPPKCNGKYSNMDRSLVSGTLNKESTRLYSRSLYKCPPVTTCLVKGVEKLPNIPKQVYNVYNRTLFSVEPTNLHSNILNKQCGLK